MSENAFTSIRNQVIGGLILLAIGAAIPVTREWLLSLAMWCWAALSHGWNWLWVLHALPGWLIVTGGLLALFGLVMLLRRILPKFRPPEYVSYVEDSINGAVWRWGWEKDFNGKWCISNLHGFCPACEARLVYSESPRWTDDRYTGFICENCGNVERTRIRGGGLQYALGAVSREIDRRVRTRDKKNHE